MASSLSLPEEDLSCPVCHDIFTNPVLLKCSHSFCETCIQDCWKDKESRDCPVCRRRSSTELPCNLALKNLSEAYKEKRSQRSSAVCSLHSEKLKLFCLEDIEPICLVCRDSRKHRSHNFVPVDEAAQDHREEMRRFDLETLKLTLSILEEFKQTWDQTADHIKTQAENTERKIKEEFKKLHQFLQEEEEARIAALREEEKQKIEEMKEKIPGMNREIAALSDTIKVIEEELRADDISFLQKLKATQERAEFTMPDLQLGSRALIDMAKHLGNLTFRVWEKMKGMVKFTPVILDPNTAHPRLSLSDDLTSVELHHTRQLPNNPERFNKYADVLGSEGFSSGKHSWEVEVGDHPHWTIGVARESVDRNRDRLPKPNDGIWCIRLKRGEYYNGMDNLPLKKRPERIRVQMDCDRGEVSFYDTEDMTHIFTHNDTFTEKLYPYIGIRSVGCAYLSRVKILQSEFSVRV